MENNQRPDGPWRIEPETLEAALETEFAGRPALTPALKNWVEDLPGQNEEQKTAPRLTWVNEINDIWMEIPRFENILWWGAWVGGVSLIIPLIMISFFMTLPNFFFNVSITIFCLVSYICFVSLLFFNFRTVLFSPRGTPIRFNRQRQKIYVYEYQRKWNPWVRWPTTIKVFDWADVHAQMTRETGRYDQGYRLYGVVCKPGTIEVMDRFILTWTVGSVFDAYGLWSHCCHYMQAKPVPTTPLLTKAPASWTPFNTVRWPADIDRESTTAPEATCTESCR
jgi:hypothetical protein